MVALIIEVSCQSAAVTAGKRGATTLAASCDVCVPTHVPPATRRPSFTCTTVGAAAALTAEAAAAGGGSAIRSGPTAAAITARLSLQ